MALEKSHNSLLSETVEYWSLRLQMQRGSTSRFWSDVTSFSIICDKWFDWIEMHSIGTNWSKNDGTILQGTGTVNFLHEVERPRLWMAGLICMRNLPSFPASFMSFRPVFPSDPWRLSSRTWSFALMSWIVEFLLICLSFIVKRFWLKVKLQKVLLFVIFWFFYPR